MQVVLTLSILGLIMVAAGVPTVKLVHELYRERRPARQAAGLSEDSICRWVKSSETVPVIVVTVFRAVCLHGINSEEP